MSRKSVATSRTKVMQCSSCKRPMTVGTNTRNAPRCIECGTKEAVDSAHQMAQKSGPYYEAWVNAMTKFAASLPRTGEGGIQIESSSDEIVSRGDQEV